MIVVSTYIISDKWLQTWDLYSWQWCCTQKLWRKKMSLKGIFIQIMKYMHTIALAWPTSCGISSWRCNEFVLPMLWDNSHTVTSSVNSIHSQNDGTKCHVSMEKGKIFDTSPQVFIVVIMMYLNSPLCLNSSWSRVWYHYGQCWGDLNYMYLNHIA